MYFLDTNTISYLLEGNTAVLQEYLLARETDVIRVPDIVYYEVYRGLLYRDSRKLMTLKKSPSRSVTTSTCSGVP